MKFILQFIKKFIKLLSSKTNPTSWVEVGPIEESLPVLDTKRLMEERRKAILAHNQAFLIKFDRRIKDIQKSYQDRGIKNFKLPIIQDDEGRLMWAPRSYRRKHKMA